MTKRFTKHRIFYIFMTVLVAVVIFFSSSLQATAGEITGLNLASFYHLVVFFMFTFFLTLSLKSDKIDFKIASVILLLSLAYAISDEFHQLFVIGRFASAKDVLVDFAGSLFSLLVVKDSEFFNRR